MEHAQLLLLGTEGCHLCDLAYQVLANIGLAQHIQIIDIAENEHMVEQFGERIPVLQDSLTKDCLNWPFNEQQVIEWLEN
ncbi:hypothetical protein DS2_16579 [Catenovulum agarivorans DS-2]|uniref:Glutaredoxin family protein n=1 Tax=Catenovulum agarivorans DS-2 TaxID=1328313 RepID=W7QT51_9ALTE|nr:glutaredoxin family protein [Catenovulum agarivorans]EWH08580.1 hypothetical protein DS2_16579 [Catenovulum agarivorans DS-2]